LRTPKQLIINWLNFLENFGTNGLEMGDVGGKFSFAGAACRKNYSLTDCRRFLRNNNNFFLMAIQKTKLTQTPNVISTRGRNLLRPAITLMPSVIAGRKHCA